MCGIGGAIANEREEVVRGWVAAITEAQTHRGPDDDGLHSFAMSSGSIALGSRRLAILDLSRSGHQPMINNKTGDVLAYNGEVYNYLELRKELKARGHEFFSDTDTEVVLRAYEQWGTDCLPRFKGMFAFSLWDAKSQSVLLARDPLGIKPLYLRTLEAGLAWASETQALSRLPLPSADLSVPAMTSYLAYGSVPEPLTIYEDVSSLPAGTFAIVAQSGTVTTMSSFWSPPSPRIEGLELSDLKEEGRALLRNSLTRHMRSDVPVGVFLSSGLDSTAVAGFAQQVTDSQVQTFTVSLPDQQSLDETSLASATARRLGTTHTNEVVDDPVEWAREGLAAMDQPSFDGLNTYIVSRATTNAGLVVALSGLGGDELFGGYQSFFDVPKWKSISERIQWVPARLRQTLSALAARKRGHVAASKARDLGGVTADLPTLYTYFRRLLSNGDLVALGLASDTVGLSKSYLPPGETLAEALVTGDPIASVSRLESRFYMKNTLLRDADVFSMASSLEVRVPLLDLDLVEWAMSLPGSVLIPKGAPPKHMLRQLSSDFYSPEQSAQPKRGFVLPISQWIQGPLKELVNGAFSSVKKMGAIDSAALEKLKRTWEREPETASWSRIWALTALGSWLDAHSEQSAGVTG
jgi:asparagine synthase (glutamine-hydrolysing)